MYFSPYDLHTADTACTSLFKLRIVKHAMYILAEAIYGKTRHVHICLSTVKHITLNIYLHFLLWISTFYHFPLVSSGNFYHRWKQSDMSSKVLRVIPFWCLTVLLTNFQIKAFYSHRSFYVPTSMLHHQYPFWVIILLVSPSPQLMILLISEDSLVQELLPFTPSSSLLDGSLFFPAGPNSCRISGRTNAQPHKILSFLWSLIQHKYLVNLCSSHL